MHWLTKFLGFQKLGAKIKIWYLLTKFICHKFVSILRIQFFDYEKLCPNFWKIWYHFVVHKNQVFGFLKHGAKHGGS